MRKKLLTLAMLLTLTAAALPADQALPEKPGKKDRCPVCGMFVAKYPQWIGVVVIEDAPRYFDGCKCMFRYLQSPAKYGTDERDVKPGAIYVTDYYSTRFIDGRQAFYVTGSDVLGPMGHELIPFKTEKDARAFAKDHQGKRVLAFESITKDVVKSLMRKR